MSDAYKEPELRHKCPDGHHRLIARVIGGTLQFQCDQCKNKYYWDIAFLKMLIGMMETGADFTLVFE